MINSKKQISLSQNIINYYMNFEPDETISQEKEQQILSDLYLIQKDCRTKYLRNKKFQFFEELEKHKNIDDGYDPPHLLIDPLIFDLVFEFNTIKTIRTTQSCQGHLAKNLLKRQNWGDGVIPANYKAHISFTSSLKFDDIISFCRDVVKIETIERITHEIEISAEYFVVWWNINDSIEGEDKIKDLINYHFGHLRDKKFINRFQHLKSFVLNEWNKETWCLRG